MPERATELGHGEGQQDQQGQDERKLDQRRTRLPSPKEM
jgi:hypothetical protein